MDNTDKSTSDRDLHNEPSKRPSPQKHWVLMSSLFMAARIIFDRDRLD